MKPRDARHVMAGRREPPDSLNYFPTPPWCTRALLDGLRRMVVWHMGRMVAWDPAAGEGHMVGPLEEAFRLCVATDIFDYGRGYEVLDFLDPAAALSDGVDWIINNPPFPAAEAFALQAVRLARSGVAMLVRSSWVAGTGRFERLFQHHPPAFIWQFCERVPIVKGRWDPQASTATDYCWVIWVKAERTRGGVDFRWIPPGACRRFTRPDDIARYGVVAAAPLLDGMPA